MTSTHYMGLFAALATGKPQSVSTAAPGAALFFPTLGSRAVLLGLRGRLKAWWVMQSTE